MADRNKPVYARAGGKWEGNDQQTHKPCQDGLTLREHAVLSFMCALVSQSTLKLDEIKEKKVANEAAKLADAYLDII